MGVIDRLQMRFDSRGDVIPAEHFSGNGKKNYIAQIVGRDPKYTWRRQWLQKVITPGSTVIRYKLSAFVVDGVYEIHASFLPTPVEESELQKRGKFDKEKWRKDRMNRINSRFNGFWIVAEITSIAVRLKRMYTGDMNKKFPRHGVSNDYQSSLNDFINKEEHIL